MNDRTTPALIRQLHALADEWDREGELYLEGGEEALARRHAAALRNLLPANTESRIKHWRKA